LHQSDGVHREEDIVAVPRPYWKGYLKLSLVSCPIAVYTAASAGERVAFRMINRKTGNRIRQQYVDEATHGIVEGSDKARGYEYAKNAYVLVEDEELEAIAIESTHTIEIDKFVPRPQIDERYLDSPYYIAPNDQVGQEAFAVIREAMRGKDMVALARIVLAKRERVMMLQPWENGLLGTSLRYGYEVRDAKEYFGDIDDIRVPQDMLKLAEHILETKASDFDPSEFVDRYEEAVVEMLKKKQAGLPLPRAKAEPPPQNVINLMDALKRSLAADKSVRAPAAKQRAKRRVEGQGEMLLPIAGKGGKEREKPAARPAARQKKAG
jgi:DNA end-binding protein Ku